MKINNFKASFFIALFLASGIAIYVFFQPHINPLLESLLAIENDSDKINSDPITAPLQANLTIDNALLLAKQTEIVDTTKSLPLTPLKCATAPTSTYALNVKQTGAKGDGITDDTRAIQDAIDQIAGSGDTVLIPPGTYMINATSRLNLRSKMTLRMEPGTILKTIPNNKELFAVINVKDAENINIIGGIIQGDRDKHLGESGEWGMGVELYGSRNVVIENIISKDHWGDGFYVANNAKNTKLCSVVGDNNRRNGISIVSADDIIVKDSIFQRGNSPAPLIGHGLDIEPNQGQTVKNYLVLNSKFLNNNGYGIISTVPDANTGKAFVLNGLIEGNLVVNNGQLGRYSAGILLSQQTGIVVSNNIVINNHQDGIGILNRSKSNIIKGNTIMNSGNPIDKKYGYGITMEESTDNIIENNNVLNSVNQDIFDENGKNVIKTNNANKIKSK